jgi:mono/diheme cytochrome c family protein
MAGINLARCLIGISCAVGIISADSTAFSQPANQDVAQAEQQWSTVQSYCFGCHNSIVRAGDLLFDELSAESVPEHPEIFETAVRKLRGRLMPPPGNPQPSQEEINALVGWLENTLDESSEAILAGHVPVQRMNRNEYANAVKGLLDVEIDPEEYLPAEIEVEGFNNIAAALSVSPAFLEQYVSVARAVARMAVGDPVPAVTSVSFPPPIGDQDGYVEGMPFGTRGGTRFDYVFPADGEYRITITDLDIGLYPRGIENETTVVVLIDRAEVFRGNVGGEEDRAFLDRFPGGGAPAGAEIMKRFADIPLQVSAGVHEVVVTFIERSRVATDDPIAGGSQFPNWAFVGYLRLPRLVNEIQIEGPYEAGPTRTASREKIFICEPEAPEQARACAERITASLAQRAFRRPVTSEDTGRLMDFYDSGYDELGGFDAGIEQMVTAVLVSPEFLYRGIAPPQETPNARFHPLNDLELASRLSFFLWSQGPDDELLELANAGELRSPDVLDAQVRRMLAAPPAETLATNFALRWLNLDEVDEFEWDRKLFPEFSAVLREDFTTEIDLFLRSILLEDRNVQELLTAEHTFLNERLARHYGITSVRGAQFRRVILEDEARHGLLGKGAVLLHTSYGNRTSLVLRGAWVLDKLVGTPPTPPPPDVETDLSTPEGEQPKTLRAMFEEHRANPTCNACHGVIDPHGLTLENFTVTGQWRDVDWQADAPIDASAVLPDGGAIEGPTELRQALLRRPDQFVQALTEKLMMYALGRELEYHDMPQVRAIVRAAAEEDYRFSSIVAGIVASDAFRMQALEIQALDMRALEE